MIRYLLTLLFLTTSCLKINNLNLRNVQKDLIEKKLLNLFEKGENLEDLFKKLKEEALENRLSEIYTDKQLNLLMLTLKSPFDKKEREQIFGNILLYICLQDDILKLENFNKVIGELFLSTLPSIASNPFKKAVYFMEIGDSDKNKLIDKIFNKEFKINLSKIKENLNLFDIEKLKKFLNKFDAGNETLIFYSFYLGQKSFIDFLIDLVDLEISNKNGETPLAYTICNRPEVVKYLCEKKYIDKFKKSYNEVGLNRKRNDPLVYAILSKNAELVNLLLSEGFDPNSIDENKNKAILLAAYINCDEIVNILLARGAKYLNKEKIVLRKGKKAATKAGASALQLASDIAFRASGAPLSINTTSFNSFLRNSHTLNRTQAYTKIFKIFLKGEWVNLESYSTETIVKFKDLLSGLKYYVYKFDNKRVESEVQYYESGITKFRKKIAGFVKKKQNNIKARLLKLRGLHKNLEKLEDNFNSINLNYLNSELENLYKKVSTEFFKKGNDELSFLEIRLDEIMAKWSLLDSKYKTLLSLGEDDLDLSMIVEEFVENDNELVELEEIKIDNLRKKGFNLDKKKLIEISEEIWEIISLIKDFNVLVEKTQAIGLRLQTILRSKRK